MTDSGTGPCRHGQLRQPQNRQQKNNTPKKLRLAAHCIGSVDASGRFINTVTIVWRFMRMLFAQSARR